MTIRPERYSPESLAVMMSTPYLEAAAAFGDAFEPDAAFAEAGGYDWVADLAPKRWELWLAAYQKLDDKAASVLAWVSGGTGVLAVGVAVAVADRKMSPWVAVFFLPAIVVAVCACVMAAFARTGQRHYPAPDVRTCLTWVEHRGTAARAAVLGEWHKATASLISGCNRRARALESGLRCGTWAVIGLALPVLAAIVWAFANPPKPDEPRPEIRVVAVDRDGRPAEAK